MFSSIWQTFPWDRVVVPPRQTFKSGLTLMSEPNTEASLVVIFIHDIGDNAQETWKIQAADEKPAADKKPWPVLMAEMCTEARIFLYGYDTSWATDLASLVDPLYLTEKAELLLKDLGGLDGLREKPLVFFAHGFGGLMYECAVVQSKSAERSWLADRRHGAFLFGTPHQNAGLAEWAIITAKRLGIPCKRTPQLQDWTSLKPLIKSTSDMQSKFRNLIEDLDSMVRIVGCWATKYDPYSNLKLSPEWAVAPEFHLSIAIEDSHFGMTNLNIKSDSFREIKVVFGSLVKELDQNKPGIGELSGTTLKSATGLIGWTHEKTPISVGPQEIPKSPIYPQLLQDCLRSLAFLEMDHRPNINRAAWGTSEWLFEHQKYKSWTAYDRGLLWIKGKPGSGKSTLLQYALDHIEENPGILDRTLVLSFFFNSRGTSLQKTPIGLFRSLLHQLLGWVPAAPPDLLATFQERCKNRGQPGKDWQWHLVELRRFFKSSLRKVLEDHSVLVLIDALDECGEKNAVELVQEFKSLLQRIPPTRLQFRICFTCRHYPILDWNFEFEICVERENERDISTYVIGRLSISERLRKSMIPRLIIERAQGVFIWASLIVDKVLRFDRVGESLMRIEQVIEEVPSELKHMYRGLIRDMEPTSLKLIQWICCATRTISLHELRWAMVVDADCPYKSLQECLNEEDFELNDDVMGRRVQTLSCGLAEVTQACAVRFIHPTVKEFFVQNGLSNLEREMVSTEEAVGLAHYQLFRTCVRYLAMEEIGQSTISDGDALASKFPLLHYATTSWIWHVQRSEARGRFHEGRFQENLEFWPSETLMQLWVRIYRTIDGNSRDCPPEKTLLIHVVSRYQLLRPLKEILRSSNQTHDIINARDSGGRTPLSYAAENGHEAVVKLLLDPDTVQDLDDWTSFRHDAAEKPIRVERSLPSADAAFFDAKDLDGRTPLSYAAENGHEVVVGLLLKYGASVDAKDTIGQTPSSYAAKNDHKAIVTLLHHRGALST